MMSNHDKQAAAIEAKDLTKQFGDFTAVDGVTFDVQRGEIFGFLGPNGSGKTTTIRMLLGLLQPNRGEAVVLGVSIADQPGAIRSRVGYMSQHFSLYNDLTVIQNLRFYGTAYGLKNDDLEAQIQRSLRMAGLEGRERAETRELSGGWRQRLALGAAILHRPEVLFLDEPTAGVDPLSRREFWDLLYQLIEEGVTVLVTTHYMDEAEHCQRLAFIQRGRLIAMGTPAELKNRVLGDKVIELEPDDPLRALQVLRTAQKAGEGGLREVELYGSLVHLVTGDSQRTEELRRLLEREGIGVRSISSVEPSLEDVFIASMRAGG
jgi:ABC-2 type transport system ATP-binding protein